MKRLSLVLIALVVGLLALACGSDKTTIVTSPTTQRGITVMGHGEVQAPPDTGFFQVGVQVRAATVAAARDAASKAADAVTKSLKANGIADADIRTTNYSINPEFDYRATTPKLTGYVVMNTVEVKVRKVDTFSKVIDDATAAGGDSVQVQSVRFDVADNSKLLDQARQAAVDDARKKAEQLAKLGGGSLGKPISISETQSSRPQPVVADYAGGEPSKTALAVPISPGSGTVTVDISATWDLGN